ncbi:Hypothetical protein, putative [Bodo saltans]|uniref:Uncharacterized protein n=1 Tax=Bodo saltans TaxID=75058 RepID=A0A0S4J031_BODSA|nr:Hypothetical protein, putative [Bodo saltans]|eukprot:CUG28123.1 Hypothetical protein, putative [Bodo saltans]
MDQKQKKGKERATDDESSTATCTARSCAYDDDVVAWHRFSRDTMNLFLSTPHPCKLTPGSAALVFFLLPSPATSTCVLHTSHPLVSPFIPLHLPKTFISNSTTTKKKQFPNKTHTFPLVSPIPHDLFKEMPTGIIVHTSFTRAVLPAVPKMGQQAEQRQVYRVSRVTLLATCFRENRYHHEVIDDPSYC